MHCPHCQKEIMKDVMICPYCYVADGIECHCEGGGSYECHICHNYFQAYNGYYYSHKPKKQLGKIQYCEKPFEWENGW